MKRHLRHILLSMPLAACVPWTSATAAVAPCATLEPTHAQQTSQRILDALVETNGVPGMGAAVWRDGKVVWTGCSGLRDVANASPVRRDTEFRFASVSKLLTATAAAKLAQEGRLDLDSPVAQLLPWLRNRWPAISVRQLAAHISGMPHYQAGDDDVGKRHYANGRAAVQLFSARALLSPPGTAYSYSSWGYTLIGAVVEQVSGQHFVEYIRDEITPGLAIRGDTDGKGATASRLYEIGVGAPRLAKPNDFSYTWPGGGMSGTPEALVQFAGRLMQGRIVASRTWQAMREPTRMANGKMVSEREYEVALGWRVGTDIDGAPIAHHAGVTDGARSALVVWPTQETAASVLSNALWVSSIESTAMMLAAPHREVPPGLAHAACPVTATHYRGRIGELAFEGSLKFRRVDGRCVGALASNAALDKHFKSASAWPNRELSVIALESDGQLARAALVTPYGIYDLRATSHGHWSASLGGPVALHIEL